MYDNKYKILIFSNILLSISSLLVGGLLYLGFRSERLLMFEWGERMHLNGYITHWRNICSSYSPPEWITYALPDGLWLFSYMLLIQSVWINTDNKTSKIWLYMLPFIAVSSEIIQICGKQFGTFDVMDLTCYVGAIIIFIIKTKLQ
ncbi:MAG: hypothetical protein IJX44_09085 [Bacteroidaceae bacterium]|nr:hypothetical protein [Bacteroidaceae bacterium]